MSNTPTQIHQMTTGLESSLQLISGWSIDFRLIKNLIYLEKRNVNLFALIVNFSAAMCKAENTWVEPPLLCTAPIKVFFYVCFTCLLNNLVCFLIFHKFLQYQFANYLNADYNITGKGQLRIQLINQREDFSFALFSGGLLKVFNKGL